MKIYNEVTIDMNPESSSYGKTLHEDSFEYDRRIHGPMMLMWNYADMGETGQISYFFGEGESRTQAHYWDADRGELYWTFNQQTGRETYQPHYVGKAQTAALLGWVNPEALDESMFGDDAIFGMVGEEAFTSMQNVAAQAAGWGPDGIEGTDDDGTNQDDAKAYLAYNILKNMSLTDEQIVEGNYAWRVESIWEESPWTLTDMASGLNELQLTELELTRTATDALKAIQQGNIDTAISQIGDEELGTGLYGDIDIEELKILQSEGDVAGILNLITASRLKEEGFKGDITELGIDISNEELELLRISGDINDIGTAGYEDPDTGEWVFGTGAIGELENEIYQKRLLQGDLETKISLKEVDIELAHAEIGGNIIGRQKKSLEGNRLTQDIAKGLFGDKRDIAVRASLGFTRAEENYFDTEDIASLKALHRINIDEMLSLDLQNTIKLEAIDILGEEIGSEEEGTGLYGQIEAVETDIGFTEEDIGEAFYDEEGLMTGEATGLYEDVYLYAQEMGLTQDEIDRLLGKIGEEAHWDDAGTPDDTSDDIWVEETGIYSDIALEQKIQTDYGAEGYYTADGEWVEGTGDILIEEGLQDAYTSNIADYVSQIGTRGVDVPYYFMDYEGNRMTVQEMQAAVSEGTVENIDQASGGQWKLVNEPWYEEATGIYSDIEGYETAQETLESQYELDVDLYYDDLFTGFFDDWKGYLDL